MIRKDNDRPSVQVVGSTIYLRASYLGACVRAIAAAIAGRDRAERSEMLINSAKEGHLHERAMEEYIRDTYELELVDQQGMCEWTYEVGGWTFIITGHYEGKWAKAGIPVYLWENKSMSKDQYPLWVRSLEDRGGMLVPTFKNHRSYAWQISHYMMCAGLPVLYSVKDRNMGGNTIAYLYEPPYSERDIEQRLSEVAAILENPLNLDNPSFCSPDANRWMCPYRDFLSCMDTNTPGIEYEEVFDEVLEDALIKYEGARLLAAQAEKDKKAARKIIEERFQAGAVVTLMGYTAKWSEYQTEDRDALKAFLEEHGKTLDDFKKKGKRLSTGGPK